MPYSNVAELRRCLEDCVEFCEEHPTLKACQLYRERLEETLDDLEESIALTDKHYAAWRREWREDKVAWKKLSKVIKEVQRRLDEVDAIGYPNQAVSYWDEERLKERVDDMRIYLKDHKDDIEFAQQYLDKLDRLTGLADDEEEEMEDSYDEYYRFSHFRRRALSQTNQVIGDFREELRTDLGTSNEGYQSIRWAMSVSPDETVL